MLATHAVFAALLLAPGLCQAAAGAAAAATGAPLHGSSSWRRGRRLAAGRRDWGDSGDPSGTEVLSMARKFNGKPSQKMSKAVTPEQAEAVVGSSWKGMYRYQGTNATVVFATVESDPLFVNPNRKKETIQAFSRVAIDSPDRTGYIDRVAGSGQVPTLAMGTAVGAQTYEGATAIAASDSIMINGDSRRPGKVRPPKTTAARSMVTSYPRAFPRVAPGISVGTTAQTARDVAVAGAADGIIVAAQANEVAAVSQASRSKADQWQRK